MPAFERRIAENEIGAATTEKSSKQNEHTKRKMNLQVVLEDLEKKRHLKDPFNRKYVDFVTSSLLQPTATSPATTATTSVEERGNVVWNSDKRSEFIEEATVHVQTRLELIQQMAKSLQKQARAAVQLSNKNTADQKQSSRSMSSKGRGKQNNERTNRENDGDGSVWDEQVFECQDTFELYRKMKDKTYDGPALVHLTNPKTDGHDGEQKMEPQFPNTMKRDRQYRRHSQRENTSTTFRSRFRLNHESVSSGSIFAIDRSVVDESTCALLLSSNFGTLLKKSDRIDELEEDVDDASMMSQEMKTILKSVNIDDCIDLQIDSVNVEPESNENEDEDHESMIIEQEGNVYDNMGEVNDAMEEQEDYPVNVEQGQYQEEEAVMQQVSLTTLTTNSRKRTLEVMASNNTVRTDDARNNPSNPSPDNETSLSIENASPRFKLVLNLSQRIVRDTTKVSSSLKYAALSFLNIHCILEYRSLTHHLFISLQVEIQGRGQ